MNSIFSPFILMRIAACAALLASTGGCIAVATSAATETAAIIAQERSVGDAIDDAGILFAIKDRYIQRDMNDLLTNVLVKVVEGRVLLTGNVDKPETQVEAVRLAWTVKGVREVINEIQVNETFNASNYARDVWISTQIRARLVVAAHIQFVNYSVITVNQTVYLMGIAQNQEELDKVTAVASTTAYVQRVVSYVRLKSDPNRPQ